MKQLFFIICFSVLFAASGRSQSVRTPDDVFGDLFVAVQMSRVFPDSKSFADAVPKRDPQAILADYVTQKRKTGFSLYEFVQKNFILAPVSASGYRSNQAEDVEKHILQLWNALKRNPDKEVAGNSLLPLPYAYVVPGGRFREVYYWDTYFTMLGLQASGETELIEHMINNFEYMLKTYGHIPNGNRSYYLSRSQPPYFSLMVELLAGIQGEEVYKRYGDALQIEYDYWMDKTADTRHVVSIEDGVCLNRYWDQLDIPRQESFFEDFILASIKPNPQQLYRELRSGAESGWDFSSRWFSSSGDLASIQCTNILPVDLNGLLHHLERTLALSYRLKGDSVQAGLMRDKAKLRLDAINRYCYDASEGWYYDYIVSEKRLSKVKTIAGMMPFFLKIAPVAYADRAAEVVEQDFLRPGGVVTTLKESGQQWDAPNGWAPLQWITIKGLDAYGKKTLAKEIVRRWIALNTKVYRSTGKLMEKYNVENLGLLAGGGEYPAQDGFGWTNGVLLRLIREYD